MITSKAVERWKIEKNLLLLRYLVVFPYTFGTVVVAFSKAE
jgi:hypothetical protein